MSGLRKVSLTQRYFVHSSMPLGQQAVSLIDRCPEGVLYREGPLYVYVEVCCIKSRQTYSGSTSDHITHSLS